MNFHRSLTCFLLLSLTLIFRAQTKTGAVIYFSEKGCIIYLDNSKIKPSQTPTKLDTGWHKITAWAPSHKLLSDSFRVKQDRITFYARHLELTDEYKKYKTDLKRHNAITFVPPIFTIASGISFFLIDKNIQKKIDNKYNDALTNKAAYERSVTPEDFVSGKANYDTYITSYNNLLRSQKQWRTVGIITTSLGALATTASIIHLTKNRKPSYFEKPLLSRMDINYFRANRTNFICINYIL